MPLWCVHEYSGAHTLHTEPANPHIARPYLLLVILCLAFPLSLISIPDSDAGIFFEEFSNLGHILYFALFSYFILQLSPVSRCSAGRQCLLALSSTLFAGIAIELLQSLSTRTPSLMDVGRDLTGALLILCFFRPWRLGLRPGLRLSCQFLVVIMILSNSLVPSFRIYDRLLGRQQFPLFSSLEEPSEIFRWSRGERVDSPARQGHYSLRATFTTEEYSAVEFNYLPADWNGYDRLLFSIHNPHSEPVALYIKIHDKKHEELGQLYNDRYNHRWLLRQGWNDLSISLTDIESAPTQRRMDLSRITTLQFFTHRLNRPQNLYFDQIGLKKDDRQRE